MQEKRLKHWSLNTERFCLDDVRTDEQLNLTLVNMAAEIERVTEAGRQRRLITFQSIG